MVYKFEAGGKVLATLTMPDDVECFEVLGTIMDKVNASFVTLEKEQPMTEDEEKSKRIWDMVNEMEAE